MIGKVFGNAPMCLAKLTTVTFVKYKDDLLIF